MVESAEYEVPDISASVVHYRLSATLYDDLVLNKLSNVDYKIEGPNGEELSGTTDGEGHLIHEGVSPGLYKVMIDDNFAFIPSLDDDSIYYQRIPNSQWQNQQSDSESDIGIESVQSEES